MAPHYKHTQPGYVMLGAVGGTALFMASTLLKKAGPTSLLLLPPAFLLGVVGAIFSSLTVEITDEELRASFGPGLTIKRVKLGDIESVQTVRNPWYYGWGIRITPRGMLYNVSGLDAVEVRLRSGQTFRLGTDEPERLRLALDDARARVGGGSG